MGKIGEIIGKVIGGSTGTVIESVGKVVDEFTISNEEKAAIQQKITEELNRHQEATQRLMIEQLQAELGDISNAREREAKIATNENAAWITRNATTLLAFAFVGTTLTLYILSVTKAVDIHENILRDLRDIVILIMGYYFGSSVGSHAKSKQLDKVLSK